MRLELKEINLHNFKGCSDRTLAFDGNTKILGANATGKSTTGDAWFWILSDCNLALTKNPPITPLGKSECISRVEAELEIDGNPLSIAKSQKFKTKETDGKITSSITNTYEINSVEKSYKDFVSDLSERGIPMEDFLIYSHPAFFTNDSSKQGREKQRALLFKMCEGITDAEIAKGMDKIDELKQLLDSYKLEEIEQMQKSTLKKIKENVGVDNSIINARIEEVISQKVSLDKEVLEEQKRQYEAELERITAELHNASSRKLEIRTEMLNLNLAKEKLTAEANQKLNEARSEFDKAVKEMYQRISEYRFQLNNLYEEIYRAETMINEAESDLEVHRKMYKEEQDRVMSDDELICPVCKQAFPEDKAETIKADFDANKAKRLETIESTGEKLKAKIEANKAVIEGYKEKKEQYESTLNELEENYREVKAKLDKIPDSVDMLNDEKYIEIINKIDALQQELDKSDETKKEELTSQKNMNAELLNHVLSDLAKVENNEELDKRVSELREERKEAEIKRAKAEQILYEVELFKKEKNNRLSDEVNKHFKVVDFKLFKTLKNGSVEDACDVLVDGKEINTQVNQATQILAKLDIIRGISDFFKIWCPVFIDDFALFTEESEKKISMDNQLIKLVATDGVNELKIERG